MQPTLAYGGFDLASPDGDVARTLDALASVFALALLAYVPASITASRLRSRRYIAIPVFIAITALFLPQFRVMGEPGPMHVAMPIGLFAFPLLFVVLTAKVIILSVRDRRARRAA